MMNDCKKRELKDRLYDLMERLQGVTEIIEADDISLAKVSLMDIAGQIQRINLKLTTIGETK